MIELVMALAFEVLPNRTVTVQDKTMHTIVEMSDCRKIRDADNDEFTLKTDEEYPYCYIVQKEPIMIKKDGTWTPAMERTWK